jgi:hypothetical protein
MFRFLDDHVKLTKATGSLKLAGNWQIGGDASVDFSQIANALIQRDR